MKLGIIVATVLALSQTGCRMSKSSLNTRLLWACRAHRLEDVKDDLAGGADPNYIEPGPDDPFSTLDRAIDSPQIVAALLKAGASPSKPDGTGLVPIGMAAAVGTPATLKLLIDAGGKVDQRDFTGDTPLIKAAQAIRSENAELLIKEGADVNAANKVGLTPLMYAAMKSSKDPSKIATVRLLLANGADPNAKDPVGRTAADLATKFRLTKTPVDPLLIALLKTGKKQK
jgi:uncharacterized protein